MSGGADFRLKLPAVQRTAFGTPPLDQWTFPGLGKEQGPQTRSGRIPQETQSPLQLLGFKSPKLHRQVLRERSATETFGDRIQLEVDFRLAPSAHSVLLFHSRSCRTSVTPEANTISKIADMATLPENPDQAKENGKGLRAGTQEQSRQTRQDMSM
jgi:hypothetical protein